MNRCHHRRLWRALASAICCLLIASLSGCKQPGAGDGPVFLSMGTAPVGGTFPVVGGAIAEVLNEHKGENNWKVQPKGTKGSQENIRRLEQGGLELGISNAAITYFAVRGEGGWDKPYDVQAVVTMAPNVAMFITKAGSGIEKIDDLKGKRIVIGPAGAGFEMFVQPLIQEHGLSFDDFTKLNAPQSAAVDMLADGSADAAFLGGAVPASSITQAASQFDVYFIPFDEQARKRLVEKYSFFQEVTVPQKNAKGDATYAGMTEDYHGLNVGSMHLITSADQDEELIYQITKTIWENRGEIAAKHPAGKFINEDNAARNTGVEFHPGARRFYEEIGIWPASPQAGGEQTEQASEQGSAQ